MKLCIVDLIERLTLLFNNFQLSKAVYTNLQIYKEITLVLVFMISVFYNFGPSKVRATSGANLGRPLFQVLIFFFLLPLLKSQKGLPQGYKFLHGLLTHKNIMIPIKKKILGPPLTPALCYICADKGVYYQKYEPTSH